MLRISLRAAVPALAISLAFASPVRANQQNHSTLFAAEALRICIDTHANAASVQQLAEVEGWTVTNAEALSNESMITVGGTPNVTYYPSNYWTVDKDGLMLSILVYNIPKKEKVNHCEVIAWDLDSEAVHQALTDDPRVKGGYFEQSGFLMRRYYAKKPRRIFRYGSGQKESRTIHVLTAH